MITSGLMTLLMFFIGKKKLHYLWAIFCFTVFLFGLGVYFVAGAQTPELAIYWWRISNTGSILIPVLFLHFVYEFLEIKKVRLLLLLYVISILFVVANFTDGFFVNNMRFVFDQYYHQSPSGFLYPLYTAMFFAVTAYSHFLLWKGYKQSKDILIKNKIKFFFFGMGVSFAGGAFNFLPVYGIDIYPYMNITVFLYPLIISYAIFKHQLFDIKLVLVEIAILLLNLFLLINVFVTYGNADFTLNVALSTFIFIFSIFLIRGINKDIRDREKIEGLVKDMEIANEKLRVMEAQKTEFVSIASHQLRAPLTVIKGYASMILEGTFGVLPPDARVAMEKLFKSSEKIVSLADDLLTVSRIEQGKITLDFKTVNLGALLVEAISELKSDADESRLKLLFRSDSGDEVFGLIDEKKFKQVVKHIIENSIQHTAPGGNIRLVVQNDWISKKLRILISDTGVGMTPLQVSSIFDSPSSNNKEGISVKPVKKGGSNTEAGDSPANDGTNKMTFGIGLYIAREIIGAHHGSIRIESDGVGKGTTVIVELPRPEARV